MLTAAQQVDVRRFCGYAIYGNQASATFGGYRFFQQEGALEFRMANMAPAEEAVVVSYLATLNTMEQQLGAASATLDTAEAAVYVRNPEEIADRQELLDLWCRRLCAFLGVAPGRGVAGEDAFRLVV